MIVKPSCEGSSVGVSRVFNDDDLESAVELAARYPGELLMEQMVVGEELTVGILGDAWRTRRCPRSASCPRASGTTTTPSTSPRTRSTCVPGLEGDAEAEIRRIALAAFLAAGCMGWGRVDVMRDRTSGQFYLLEVNTAPGMTSHSLVPKAARQVGIGFEDLCWRILEQTVPGPTMEAASK